MRGACRGMGAAFLWDPAEEGASPPSAGTAESASPAPVEKALISHHACWSPLSPAGVGGLAPLGAKGRELAVHYELLEAKIQGKRA